MYGYTPLSTDKGYVVGFSLRKSRLLFVFMAV